MDAGTDELPILMHVQILQEGDDVHHRLHRLGVLDGLHLVDPLLWNGGKLLLVKAIDILVDDIRRPRTESLQLA